MLVACGLHWPEPPRAAWMVFFFLAAAFATLLFSGLATKLFPGEAEPLDPAGSSELRDGYAALRKARGWGIYLLLASMVVTFGALAVMMAMGMERVATYVGGIDGSLIGIGGAAFGVSMDNRRMRIRRRLDELCGEARDG